MVALWKKGRAYSRNETFARAIALRGGRPRIPPTVPAAVVEVIRKLWSDDVDERLTAADAADELGHLLPQDVHDVGQETVQGRVGRPRAVR